ncbi:MAG: sodium:proton antiporter [Candidatus Marinimicrobia bacterium]|nr:sodium:proton antiporter [Candidatus Neomarinimicrobiota bacterium]MBL7022992.1 sodium:proton antiporter [Candidatus Neomarinimicrobiota bacterium]
MRKNILKLIPLMVIMLPSFMFASSGGEHHLGNELPLFSIIPFVGILLSIAVLPLLAPQFWHHNFGKISAFWALMFLIPFWMWKGSHDTAYEFLHVMLLEYVPFIILLLALFTVSGGIRLKGSLVGSPKVNLIILIIGTALASWMGTTGAAMLLIRPLIRANKWRKHNVHVVIFFIFLVANIGGSLTPLGDPPLFLGFLHGVNFFWTTKAMLVPMLFTVAILLVVFFVLDSFYYKKETNYPDNTNGEKFGIEGSINFVLLIGVVASVLMSGFWHPQFGYSIMGIHLELQNILRDLLLLCLTVLSWKITKLEIRKANGYTWFPILEVAKLFAGIFITIIPAIAILKAGTHGALKSVVGAVTDGNGNPIDMMYFWLTGILSSFLDNAPTYLVFFNTAGGNAETLMTTLSSTLLAISMGAVFMGANTYIGNAPNFMVKSISEENDIKMPSFFGYMAWSVAILIPIFVVVSLIFF